MEGGGMSVVVGRIREDRVLGGIKYIVLGHNTIRGAAGTGVLIGELLARRGLAPL
jgi:aspartate-semialdehyde dehydrogenase